MNIEVEQTVTLKDPDDMRQKLQKMGAVYAYTKHQVDYYFTPHDEEFRSQGRYLRIRIEDDTQNGRLEYHTSTGETSAQECEVEISDVAMMEEILMKLGFRKVVTVDKTREAWKFGDINIVLDHLLDIGDYMEVEIMNQNVEHANQRIKEFLREQGFSELDIPNPANYYDISLAHQQTS